MYPSEQYFCTLSINAYLKSVLSLSRHSVTVLFSAWDLLIAFYTGMLTVTTDTVSVTTLTSLYQTVFCMVGKTKYHI